MNIEKGHYLLISQGKVSVASDAMVMNNTEIFKVKNMIKFVYILLFIVAGSRLLTNKAAANDIEHKRPNVILIIADDLTFRDIGPYGNTKVRTPNLDKLAKEGICLDGMYTSTAMCSPTRQQILTGMFPVRNGAYPNHSWVYADVKSIPDYLRPLGYHVAAVGKEDFGPPSSFSFLRIGSKRNIGADNFDAIRRYINKEDSPFCLYIASHQPHKPWDKGHYYSYNPNELQVPPYLIDVHTTRVQLADYYAEISFLDHQVGAIMEILEKSGKKDNTVVIFTSEQGAQFPFAKWTCYENGLKTAFIVRWPGKIEPNTRSKALVQYVDVLPTLIDVAGGNPDTVYTERADAYGANCFDGKSFLDVLLGKTDRFRKYVYGIQTTLGIIGAQQPYPIRSICDGRYKYIRNLNAKVEFSNITRTSGDNELMRAWFLSIKGDNQLADRVKLYYKRPAIEFYDLKNDPYELCNLAGDSKYSRIEKKLGRKLEIWMRQQGDLGLESEVKAKSRLAKRIKEGQKIR